MARFTIGDVSDFLISSERNEFNLLHIINIMKLVKKKYCYWNDKTTQHQKGNMKIYNNQDITKYKKIEILQFESINIIFYDHIYLF